jgi:hypothetical protein
MLYQRLSDARRETPTTLKLSSSAALSAIIWLGFLALSVTSSLGAGIASEWPFQLARMLIALVGFSTCIGIHFVLGPRRGNHFWKNFAVALLICVPVSAALTIYSYYQFEWIAGPPVKSRSRLLYDFAFSFAYYLWIYISWAALYSGLAMVHQLHAKERRAAELESQAKEAQLDALRYQLNPHFFFNVLNTLSGLVSRKRLGEAEATIQNMADFLRYSLTGCGENFVPLSEEIEVQRKYLQIEKLRFGKRLVTSIDIAWDCENAAVPRLILQPLVENAIKHAVGRSDHQVDVSISARSTQGMLICAVWNSPVVEGKLEPEGLGVGLDNVRQRLAAIYNESALLRSDATADGGWLAQLQLPLRRKFA